MFEALNERLTGVFDRITGRGALSEKDVAEAMREVRVALLEADVALPVVKEFIAFATERATGEEVIRSVKPADQVVKIVYDGLIEMLGGEEPVPLNTNANPPAVVLMAGLQGSGKTTTSAKLALRLTRFDRKKVMLASLDTRRPAAIGAAGHPGQADRGRHPAHRGGRERGPDHAPGAAIGQASGLRRPDPGHRRPHHPGRRADERGGRGRRHRQARRDPAGRRQPDRPGRRSHRQGLP